MVQDQLDAFLPDNRRSPEKFCSGIDAVLWLVRVSAAICLRLRADQKNEPREFLPERLTG
ncbi:MAG TPA: hypothetical protein QGF05_08680 [Dehalococcoidia bacterium]|nr:hypothetical protein [Dehalococcoidia bacterium]